MAGVVLVDAGGTNIGSVRYALDRLGVAANLSTDPAMIRAASHVILPGVGAAARGMQRLRESGLDKVLRELIQPVLGVCLGMQLLFEHSAEGDTECLGVLPGRVRRMHGSEDLRIPHTGWNRLQCLSDDPLLEGVVNGDFAYFVHSFAVVPDPMTLAHCVHGMHFSAIVRRDNFCGMQFHPERSASVGSRLLENFLRL